MKLTRALSAVAFAAIVASTTTRADEAIDERIFADRCVKCHGKSGTGTFMLGRRYGADRALLDGRTDLTPELIRHVVRSGVVSMPALTRVEVTNAELDAIVRHLTRKRTVSNHTLQGNDRGNSL